MATSAVAILHRQLCWLTLYYSELCKLEQPDATAEQRYETQRLRALVRHHTFLHAQLLYDHLIVGLASLFDETGWDQKTRDGKQLTLEYFVQKLPRRQKAKAETLFR